MFLIFARGLGGLAVPLELACGFPPDLIMCTNFGYIWGPGGRNALCHFVDVRILT